MEGAFILFSYLLCMLATLAFVVCIVLVTFAGTWLIHCHINEDC